VLRTSARADDLVARYGGEEFAVLMSGELEDALEVAERIRRRVERECAPEHDASLHRRITVSVGVVPLTGENPTLERLLETADKEMYRAKRAGKNRVSLLEKR
jgi:diguanylate cyclase (GGDEF)-like protein